VRVLDRFDYIRRDVEGAPSRSKRWKRCFPCRIKASCGALAARSDEESRRLHGELDRYAEFIAKANEPTLLPSWEFRSVDRGSRKNRTAMRRGMERPYLSAEEVRFLSIPRGSLDDDERRQIESHVVHSFNFLTQIPWTQEFRAIPAIARAHHEKLNGKGYPFGLVSGQIPVQSEDDDDMRHFRRTLRVGPSLQTRGSHRSARWIF